MLSSKAGEAGLLLNCIIFTPDKSCCAYAACWFPTARLPVPAASEGGTGTSPLQVQPISISGTASISSSSSSVSGPFMPNLALSPPSPFTPPFWLEAHVGLQTLMRNRFSAPPGGFACRSCQGIAQAKVDALRKRGWTVVVLSQLEVEGALGGFKAGRVRVGESYDYCGLERVLRDRLEV